MSRPKRRKKYQKHLYVRIADRIPDALKERLYAITKE